MKVAFYTMGCKVNQFDTAAMEALTRQAEHTVVPPGNGADVYVINTCSVTENSDREARRLIRKLKRNHPESRIVVTGCYAQTHPQELSGIEEIDQVLGSDEKMAIADYLGGCGKSGGPMMHVQSPAGKVPLDPPMIHEIEGHTRAFIKIQDGCDFGCSFCLIPRARGEGRSRLPEKVVEQVALLAGQGYREVVLTGVNLGTYGRDLAPKESLAGLIRLLLDSTGIDRIRLSSLEPKTVTPELIDVMASSERICRHFHIPLQSGDDTILKKMNRHYTGSQYNRLIRSLAGRFPGAGFGADVMVGFPGESEAAFRNTWTLLMNLPMSYLHVFPYSERSETPAVGMNDPVPREIKQERAERLRKLSAEKGKRFVQEQIGNKIPVLVERDRDTGTGKLKGMTDNYVRVLFPGPDECKNRILPVKITGVNGTDALGRLIAIDVLETLKNNC